MTGSTAPAPLESRTELSAPPEPFAGQRVMPQPPNSCAFEGVQAGYRKGHAGAWPRALARRVAYLRPTA